MYVCRKKRALEISFRDFWTDGIGFVRSLGVGLGWVCGLFGGYIDRGGGERGEGGREVGR